MSSTSWRESGKRVCGILLMGGRECLDLSRGTKCCNNVQMGPQWATNAEVFEELTPGPKLRSIRRLQFNFFLIASYAYKFFWTEKSNPAPAKNCA